MFSFKIRLIKIINILQKVLKNLLYSMCSSQRVTERDSEYSFRGLDMLQSLPLHPLSGFWVPPHIYLASFSSCWVQNLYGAIGPVGSNCTNHHTTGWPYKIHLLHFLRSLSSTVEWLWPSCMHDTIFAKMASITLPLVMLLCHSTHQEMNLFATPWVWDGLVSCFGL